MADTEISAPLDTMQIRGNCKASNAYGEKIRTDSGGNKRDHQGWDLKAAKGTEIKAIADGTVEWVQTADSGDYGKQLLMKFEYVKGDKTETLYAFYAHLDQVDKSKGDTVTKGDVLGKSGKSGNASSLSTDEEHLHFEIRTTSSSSPGKGLTGRKDPGDVLGTDATKCQ